MSLRVSLCESGFRLNHDEYRTKVLQTTDETLESLKGIWRSAGYEEVECKGLLGDLFAKVKKMYLAEIESETQILEHARQTVTAKFEQLCTLHRKLGRATPTDDGNFGENLTDKLANLEKQIEGISKEVNDRQKLLDIELKGVHDICDKLGEKYPNTSRFSGPPGTHELSDVRLKLLKEYRLELANSVPRRIGEMKALASDCYSIQEELMLEEEGFETVPDTDRFLSYDENILEFGKTGEFLFSIHSDDLRMLQERHRGLMGEKEKRRDELAKTGTEIARLWSLLRIASDERAAFSNSFKMNLSMHTLATGRDELDRLRTIRIQSLGKIISNIRIEIAALWDELGVETHEQKECEFSLYFDPISDLSDIAADEHEKYLAALKVRVEELRPLLSKIARREAVVLERVELEHIQLNPERLTARGPKAREDRKREEGITTRVKNLDKMTKEILLAIVQWEEKHGEFRYGGQPYIDRVNQQDESYFDIRDNLRNARRKKDGKPEMKAPIRKASMINVSGGSKVLNSSQEMSTSLQTAHSVGSSNSGPEYDNGENLSAAERNSNASDLTDYTSATEIKVIINFDELK